MWAGSFICSSFKLQQGFKGLHDFELDTFHLALYTDAATLRPSTANYTPVDEVPALANGYDAGGKEVDILWPAILIDNVALCEFDDVTWNPATFTARGAMLYNRTKPGWPAVFVLDFGADRIANAGIFTVRFPGPDVNNAILKFV